MPQACLQVLRQFEAIVVNIGKLIVESIIKSIRYENAVENVFCYNFVTSDSGLFQIPMVNLAMKVAGCMCVFGFHTTTV